jgi:hypothetical protein
MLSPGRLKSRPAGSKRVVNSYSDWPNCVLLLSLLSREERSNLAGFWTPAGRVVAISLIGPWMRVLRPYYTRFARSPRWDRSRFRAFFVSLISTHPSDSALSRTSLRPRPRSQRCSASIASSYHDQCARARNIFILRCGTKDHVLLVPQSRQRVNSGRSPCRRIASQNRGA